LLEAHCFQIVVVLVFVVLVRVTGMHILVVDSFVMVAVDVMLVDDVVVILLHTYGVDCRCYDCEQ